MRWLFDSTPQATNFDQLRAEQLKKIKNYDRFILLHVARCGCKASIREMDRVYPIDQPPALPLPGCDRAECHCVYEGIVDRRSPKTRRYRVERRRAIRNDGGERRSNHGRRKGDLLASYSSL